MLHKINAQSLTQKLYRADQVRLCEKSAAAELGIEMYSLMHRAGKSVYEESVNHFPDAKNYLVLVGAGNNAGDGYIAALQAKLAGKSVTVCAVEPERELDGDAARARKEWEANGGEVFAFTDEFIEEANLIIDGMLGIGINRTIRNEFADLINIVNKTQVPVVSIDVPSGLDADTGNILGCCIEADVTVTFIGIKMGLTTGDGKQACGKLIFNDLGIGETFADQARSDATALDLAHFEGLAPRQVNSHKGSFGRLLCVGGNKGMSGAIRMTSEAALRTGTGLIKVFCHSESKVQIGAGRPELMVMSEGLEAALEWATCIAVGPGLGRDEWGQEVLNQVMEYCNKQPKPIVLDADALNLRSEDASAVALPDCVITPHTGEASRLLNITVEEVESNRFNYARQCAQRYDAVCVLKGAGTIVDDQSKSWVCRHGNPGMATAGMGDVLTGVIASLMAQGIGKSLACQFGVSIHAKAADILAEKYGQRGMLASDLFDKLRILVNQ